MATENTSTNRVVRYARGVIRWRWPIVIGTLLLAVWAGSGVRFIYFDTDYRVFFSKDNPQLKSFELLQNTYTQNDNILFVLAPRDGEIFTGPTLDVVERLTAEAWKIPYAIRVDAVTNFQHTRVDGDDLFVEDLVSDGLRLSDDALAAARSVALAEPLLINRLIAARSHVTGVNVTLQLPNKSITEVPEAVAYARDLAEQVRTDAPGIDVYLTGFAMLNNAFGEASMADMGTLVPIMYGIMMLVMFFFLRSITGTLATMLLVLLSTAIAMGFAGWFRVGLTGPSSMAPTIIMTLAIADSIHLLITMLREMTGGKNKRDAIVESLRVNMQPVFLTSVTTIIGFLTLNFSDSPPFHHLGNITAAGVGAAFLLSVIFLPALLAILPVRAPRVASRRYAWIDQLADFVIRRRRSLLWGSAVTVMVLSAFSSLNELDERFVNYFNDKVQFRTDSDFTMENLTGVYQIEHSLSAGESGGISNPEYLAKVEEFAQWFRRQPGVVHVNAFPDVMKRLNRDMHGGDAAYYRVPDNRELAAQYMLLYELSLPFGLDLNNQINIDKSATRFTVTLENVSTADILRMTAEGERWLRKNAPPNMFSYGAGPAVMFANITTRNFYSMGIGSIIALVLISFLLIFALRNLKIGLLSLVPNLAPIAMAFGVWGLVYGQVGMSLAMAFSVTIGIVVDDTIHFLSKYLRARREEGLDAQAAVRYAFSSVGVALAVTSIILVIGFSVLAFSTFKMNSDLGILTALTIALALIADFLFLPALLMRFDNGATAPDTSRDGREPSALVPEPVPINSTDA